MRTLLKLMFCDLGLHWYRPTKNSEFRWSGDNHRCRLCGKGVKWL